jgi:F-type H+-transporting ATPase subunit epsilon
MLNVRIITPKKLVREIEATSLIIPTVDGEITILPKHAHLLASLKEGVITIRIKDKEEYLSIGGGYVETDGLSVKILVSKAYGQDEINEELTKEALNNAKKILTEVKDKKDREEALSQIRRSVVDMKLLSKIKKKTH